MIVYSYEVALYFGNALEYNGYWAQEAGLFVAALSSSDQRRARRRHLDGAI